MLLIALLEVSANNFGGPSPDTGEADGGRNIGIFGAEQGTFNDTRTNNDVYFAIERGNNDPVAANQTLTFNVSVWSTNTTIRITGINGTIAYCHARRATNICDGSGGSSNPQGSADQMNILVQNAATKNFHDVGDIPPTTINQKNSTTWTLLTTNFSQFINESGFINIQLEFAWNGAARSTFLNDHSNLTMTYDTQPSAVLSAPANASVFLASANVTFLCNSTDDHDFLQVTLYHNINGEFRANQTKTIMGKQNATSFNITNIGAGAYLWNCLLNDTVTDAVFANTNFTFIVNDQLPSVSLISPPDENSSLNNNLSFVANLTDDIDLKNATLFINSTGEFTQNQSLPVSGTVATIAFNVTSLSAATYLWNILACNAANNCAFAPQNFTVTVRAQQMPQPNPSPGGSTPSLGRLESSGFSPSDSGFDKAALAQQAAQQQNQRQSQAPAASAPTETTERATSSPVASTQPQATNPLTGAAVREPSQDISKKYASIILMILLVALYFVVRRKSRKIISRGFMKESSKTETREEDRAPLYVKAERPLKMQQTQEQARKEVSSPKRMSYDELSKVFPETYKELRAKGFTRLPQREIKITGRDTLQPSDLKAMFPISLKNVKEKALKPYTPPPLVKEKKPHLEDLGLPEEVYAIAKAKREQKTLPLLQPTRKINKLPKQKKEMIQQLEGVYKTG